MRARLRSLYQGSTVNRMISALRGVLKLALGNPLPHDLAEELKGAEPGGPPAGRALGLGTNRTRVASLGQQAAQAMGDASICGLGQTAASAVQSAIAKLALFQRSATP